MSRWHTVCVAYHDEDGKDALVLDAVRPLLRELGGTAFHLRHWRRGPHLRLNVRTTEDDLHARVLPAVHAVVGEHLRRRPSAAQLDAAALLPAHRRLAEAEQEPGPLWPWRPDNSVDVEPYDSRAHVLGSERGAELVAGFYVASTEAAFTTTELVRAGRQRLWAAFDLIVATAHAFAVGGLPRGFVSFRAHAEVFLAGTPAPARLRQDWNDRSALAAPALSARLRELTAAIERGDPPAELRGWLAALDGVREHGFALVDAGELRMDAAPDGPRPQPPPDASPFLRELITNEDFHGRLVHSAGFAHYRLLLNLLYLQLTRLGVRAVDRYLLCHLVADTVEEVYALDAVEALQSNARATL